MSSVVGGSVVVGTATAIATTSAPTTGGSTGASTGTVAGPSTSGGGVTDADVVDEHGKPIVVAVPPIDDEELDALPDEMRRVALARREIERALALVEAARLAGGRAEGAVAAQRRQVDAARVDLDAVAETVRERQAALQLLRELRTQIAVAAYTSGGTADIDLEGHDLPNLQTLHYSQEVMQVATGRVTEAEAHLADAQQRRADARADVERALAALAHLEGAADRARAGQLTATAQLEAARAAFETAKEAALAAYESSGRALVSDLVAAGYVNGALPATALVTVEDGCALETRAAASWLRLRAAAAADGVVLRGGSCYRTSGEQASIFATATAGFAARPGFSMHGWGRAVDLESAGGFVSSFADPAARWLREHGMRFGWVNPDVLGPASDTPEPWHIEWTGADPSEVDSAAQTGAIDPGTLTVPAGAATTTPATPIASPTAAAARGTTSAAGPTTTAANRLLG